MTNDLESVTLMAMGRYQDHLQSNANQKNRSEIQGRASKEISQLLELW